MKRLANFNSENIKVIRGIENDEYEFITKHISNVYFFEKCNKQIVNVLKINSDILDAVKEHSLEKLMRLISEFASAFRSFIDHWETDLKRKFGKQSKEVNAFKNATAKEYDNVFAYRFIYELRNYIQHEEFPATSLTSSIDEFEKRHYILIFNRQELLESGHKWKSVQKDLMDENCQLDLLQLLPRITESMNRINNCAINCFDLNMLVESCNEVLKYKSDQIDGMRLAIIEFPPTYPKELKGKLTFVEFHFSEAESFLKGVRKQK